MAWLIWPSRSNSAYSEAALLALAFQPVVMLLSLIALQQTSERTSPPISLNPATMRSVAGVS